MGFALANRGQFIGYPSSYTSGVAVKYIIYKMGMCGGGSGSVVDVPDGSESEQRR